MNGLPFFRHVRAVLGGGRLLVLLVATIVFTTLAGAAFGYWGTTGSGTGSASTGTLNPPTNVGVSSTAGSGSVDLTWAASTGTPAAKGYFVTRTGNGTSTPACGTSANPSALTIATSCTDSGVADGTYTYTVTAVYNSWTATSASSSSVTVSNSVGTTTTLKSSSNPSVVGQQVTYTATVAAKSGSAAPTGSVTFKDGTNTISCAGGTQTLSGGVATCSVTYTAAGDHSITATYGGSTAYSGSTTSTALIQSISKADTTTTVTSSGNPSVAGQAVTFTATASAKAPGSGTPTGTVTFTDGGKPLTCSGGNQTLNAAAAATCQVTFATAGARSIAASYSGDSSYETSTGTLAQGVNAVGTTTTVASSQNPVKPASTGTVVTYSATVTSGSGTPTGAVTFMDGNSAIGCEAGSVLTLTSGVATCKVTYQPNPLGSHGITAIYSGDSTYAASTSPVLTQLVVNGTVAGIGFSAASIGSASATPICGSVGPDYTCSLTATNKGAKFSFTPAFVDSSGTVATYSAAPTTISYNDGTTLRSLSVPGGSGAASQAVTWQQTGNGSATYVFTFTDGTSTFKVTLNLK